MDQNNLLADTTNIKNTVILPKIIQTRAKEIRELEKFLSTSSVTKLVFQKLPMHMRRRAMSHNVKRLPRKVRQAHINQSKKSGEAHAIKRPSRKFRRRPRNLQKDYCRRKNGNFWLETHIWHAKRFEMLNIWNYRLPFRPNDKSFRALYRASSQHCLLQDISYFNCIELIGLEDKLIEKLKLVTDSSTGLTIGAKSLRTGAREGETTFYRKNAFPFKAMGQIKFFWNPCKQTEKVQLWLWVHAAFYADIFDCLIDLFDLKKIDNNFYADDSSETNLIELKNNLIRFRLTGPLSHSILQKSLHFPSEENTSSWFQKYLEIPVNKTNFQVQSTFWQSLKINATSELTPNLILNLITTDPRLNFPAKRTKAIANYSPQNVEIDIAPELKFGGLWCSEIREEVSENMLSNAEISERRKNYWVSDISDSPNADVLPVILVQQPGNQSGYSSGWDIILPSNWGRAFWQSFIMWGARAGGLRDFNSLRFQQNIPEFLPPDSKAGQIEETRLSTKYKRCFFNLPPNKRVNYTKYGISSPFTYPWKKLIQEWKSKTEINDFYVLRDRRKLLNLQENLSNNKILDNCELINENCLLPIKLQFLKRGFCRKFSIICLPEPNDFKVEPIEPIHKDENQKLRKDLREAHHKLLRKLRRKRIQQKKNSQEILSTKDLVSKHAEKMKDLWLPEPDTIRNSCSRQIIGFVTNGDFCFTNGKGQCIGYIVAGALPFLGKLQQKCVLVRDTCSKQYRLASLEVICM